MDDEFKPFRVVYLWVATPSGILVPIRVEWGAGWQAKRIYLEPGTDPAEVNWDLIVNRVKRFERECGMSS